MDDTDVVTVFLRDFRSGEVLLLCRSDKTGSYQGRWGAVSGYVEDETEDAEEDARREIREETGMEEKDVNFVRRGESFVLEDERLEKRWHVNPFLFDASTRDIETNYETVRPEWCSPTEILRRETVPRLRESYAAVAPSVESIEEDEQHGSAYIAGRALEVVRDTAATGTVEETRETAHELIEARPSMAVVGNRVARAAEGDTADEMERGAHAAVARAYEADGRAAENAAELIGGNDRAVTLSRSGTVAQTLEEASPDETVVAESIPGGEGVDFAEELDVPTIVVPDSCVVREVGDTGVVVVGADAVLPDGTVVNKVGSLAAALAARYQGVSFVVVASADKISPAGEEEHENEYVEKHGSRVGVFERVPSEFVELVTEEGTLSEDDVRERAEEHARLRSSL
jgi:translation initiation factor 2B subunit (eIF-2B alpha/beta/delta family)